MENKKKWARSMYKFDLRNNRIILSRKFENLLRKEENEDAYDLFVQLQSDFPNMRLSYVPKAKRNNNTQMTYAQMEAYIKCCQNSEEYLDKYQALRTASKAKKNPYSIVREWFIETFPDYKVRSFNLDEKGKIIVPAPASNDDEQGEEEVCDVSPAPSSNDELEAMREPENKVA